MNKLLVALLFMVCAGSQCFANEIFHLSSYKSRYEVDLSLRNSAGDICVINKDYLNAFLLAKKKIETTANLPPFDTAIMNDEKFNAAMFDNGLRGNLLITSGALNVIKDDVPLYAALIGHEAGHYIHKHREKRYDRKMFATVVSAIVLGAAVGNSGVALPHDTAVNLGTTLATPFGREDEHEADLEGFNLITKAGFEQSTFVRLLELLLKKEQNHNFFSTHPHPEERIDKINSFQPALPEK
jgi:predicted Zn-dependent protease